MEDETSEGKLAIGIGVLVVTAAVVIVCPAVLGAAAATVTQFIAASPYSKKHYCKNAL